ncbi:diphthamide biosynthesis protein [Lactarius psammicola]|nr:diphthamide biosynthesis protein [Lactarius psammicola]
MIFSSSAQDVIQRPVVLDQSQTRVQLTAEELSDYYELEWTANEIISNNYKRVALQFPDELLRDSVPIYHSLKRAIGANSELYVLADTSYGSCCVDEVAAQHVDADAVVHYGHACMSKNYRLPVIYVFGKKPVDVKDAAKMLLESCTSSNPLAKVAVLKHDIAYTHEAERLVSALRDVFSGLEITISYSPVPRKLGPSNGTTTEHDGPLLGDDRGSQDTTPILYVGPPSLALTNLLLTHSATPVYGYDPTTRQATLQSVQTNKPLMRRYAIVQKARDADVFGILVGTLGVASYLPLIARIRQVLVRAHKKAYTISVGKLNPAKLANFAEIECFVLVACPENSLVDAKDFFRPIVTPFELQLALQPSPTWTGEYVLDFDQVLAREPPKHSSPDVEEDDEDDDPDRPVFSLVTGKYRHAKRYGATEDDPTPAQDPSSSALILRDQDGTVSTLRDSAAGEFLQSRTFRGLETRAGLDPPSILQQGRSGIARGYEDDH